MTSETLVTAPPGTTLEDAREILHTNKVEKLLLEGGVWVALMYRRLARS